MTIFKFGKPSPANAPAPVPPDDSAKRGLFEKLSGHMNEREKAILTIGVLIAIAGCYWWQYTLSHDFRQAAIAAVAEIDSVVDHVRCGESMEHLNLAVHKAEVEVSTAADEKAAAELRNYYKDVTDGVQQCTHGIELEWVMDKNAAHKALGLK